ncbi:MAG: YceD family protein [Actinomycetota bacterium]|jgi:uncharacterized protein|nr:YceD family protein [Actinomycetota bacterium]
MIDLTPILDRAGESLIVEDRLDMGEIAVGDVTFTLREPVSVELLITNTGDGVLVEGTAAAQVRVPCSRCAESFDHTITGEISTYLLTRSRDSEDSANDGDDLECLEGHNLDVLPLVLAAIVIEAPFAPLCRPDCMGLCPECGTDLNVDSCECESSYTKESPFSSLQGMFTENEVEADGND